MHKKLTAENNQNAMIFSDRISHEPDWMNTISNLMNLAKTANETFEYDQAVKYLKTLEEIWDSKNLPDFSMELRFELYKEKGKAYTSQGKHDEAILEYQKILKYCRENKYLNIKSDTFTQIGQLLSKKGDHDRALGYLQRAIGAYRRLDDSIGLCKALRNLGVIYLELGEFDEAEITYSEAIDIAEISCDELLYADLVNNLGAIMNMKGNWRKALDYYRESLNIYKSSDEIRKSAYTKNNIGITLTEQGLIDEAFEYFKKAYKIATDIKDASLTLIVDINLANLYLKRGNSQNAKNHCRAAEHYLIQVDFTNGNFVETQKIAGKIALHEKDYESSLNYFDNALDVSREIGTQFLEAEVLFERGTLYRLMNRPFDALNDLENSYHIYTSINAEGKKEKTETVINSIEQLYLDIFNSLANDIDKKDIYTKGHSDRVASFALLLGKELGLKSYMLKTLVASALLHDIGKIKIDDSILKKDGKLTDSEYAAIKKHPEFGVELLRGKEFPWDVKPSVLHHHERIDGMGYPLGLKGEDIPIGARILCVVDVFDALTSNRVYRKAFTTEKAISIMQEDSGKAFDSVILTCFVNLIRAGKAESVINAQTDEDELTAIWSQCLIETNLESKKLETIVS